MIRKVVFAALLSLVAVPPAWAYPSKPELVLAFTSNVLGFVSPCG